MRLANQLQSRLLADAGVAHLFQRNMHFVFWHQRGNMIFMRLFVILCILLIPLPLGLGVIGNVYSQCNSSGQNISSVRSRITSDTCLNLFPVKVGTQIPLHSVIEMPDVDEQGFLSIEFPRSEVEDQFIRDMFYNRDNDIVGAHPFSSNGIEPILTKDKLILDIHSGVILHLRNDMILSPDYKTFRSERIKGIVTEVRGKVLLSREHSLIREKLQNVFVMFKDAQNIDVSNPAPGTKIIKNPDGSTTIIAPSRGLKDIPPKYFPRIIEDGKL